ncbi:MAG: hypothetical protein V4581_04890 [Bacteroidota bacterium]
MAKKVLYLLALAAALACNSCNEDKTPTPAKTGPGISVSIFVWQDALCDNRGYFSAGKYTATQLKDTKFLCYDYHDHLIDVNIPTTPQSFANFNEDQLLLELREAYNKSKEELNSLTLVPVQFWEDLRKGRLRELEENYKVYRLRVNSINHPGMLLQDPHGEDCRWFAEALNAEDAEMMEAWHTFIVQKVEGGKTHPDAIKRYDWERQSADSVMYAKIHLHTYGWYNCALDNAYNIDYEHAYYKDFEALFTKVTSECDEP